jgi:hypothetical protein
MLSSDAASRKTKGGTNMITATFYKNGFTLNDHARGDICSQVSILAWAMHNVMLQSAKGEFYTSDYDGKPEEGRTHGTFDESVEEASKLNALFRNMLIIWGEHYQWFRDGHLRVLDLPDDCYELPQAIGTNEILRGEAPEAVSDGLGR